MQSQEYRRCPRPAVAASTISVEASQQLVIVRLAGARQATVYIKLVVAIMAISSWSGSRVSSLL